MRESLFNKLIGSLYGVFLVIFGWMIYAQPENWWQVVGLAALFTPAYLWSAKVTRETARRQRGFAPELDGAPKKNEKRA